VVTRGWVSHDLLADLGNNAVEIAKSLKPSLRGELEITDIGNHYLATEQLKIAIMGRRYAWLDTGTHETLIEASNFIQIIEKRQGLKAAYPEDIALCKGFLNADQLRALANPLTKNGYGQYLLRLLATQPDL
jgi:glucose-1-phosphate thymidylyltransferase